MAAPLYVTQSGRLWHAGLILIVTVGLPGLFHPIVHLNDTNGQLGERRISQEHWNDIYVGWELKLESTRLAIIGEKY